MFIVLPVRSGIGVFSQVGQGSIQVVEDAFEWLSPLDSFLHICERQLLKANRPGSRVSFWCVIVSTVTMSCGFPLELVEASIADLLVIRLRSDNTMSGTTRVAVRDINDCQVLRVALIDESAVVCSPLKLNSTVRIVSDRDVSEHKKAIVTTHDAILATSVAEVVFVDSWIVWLVPMEDAQTVGAH